MTLFYQNDYLNYMGAAGTCPVLTPSQQLRTTHNSLLTLPALSWGKSVQECRSSCFLFLMHFPLQIEPFLAEQYQCSIEETGRNQTDCSHMGSCAINWGKLLQLSYQSFCNVDQHKRSDVFESEFGINSLTSFFQATQEWWQSQFKSYTLPCVVGRIFPVSFPAFYPDLHS